MTADWFLTESPKKRFMLPNFNCFSSQDKNQENISLLIVLIAICNIFKEHEGEQALRGTRESLMDW